MQFSSTDLLKRIFDEANFISNQIDPLLYDNFESNSTLQKAMEYSLTLIGTASEHLPLSFKNQYQHVSWKEFAEIKNDLVYR